MSPEDSPVTPTFFLDEGRQEPTRCPAASMMKEMFSLCGPEAREEPSSTVHLLRSAQACRQEGRRSGSSWTTELGQRGATLESVRDTRGPESSPDRLLLSLDAMEALTSNDIHSQLSIRVAAGQLG